MSLTAITQSTEPVQTSTTSNGSDEIFQLSTNMSSCCEKVKQEIKCSNFGFGHNVPGLFVLSQCGPKIIYPIWTTFWLLYHLAWLIYEIYTRVHEDKESYFIKLTNWSYIVLFVTNLADVICTLYVHCRKTDTLMMSQTQVEPSSMPWYLQLTWFLFEITNTAALLVTILFYGLLNNEQDAISVEYHAINTVYAILNMCVCGKPVRVLHFIYPFIYGAIYSTFSAIYQLGGDNPPLYPVLDWTKPGTAILYVIILLFVAVPVCHMAFFGLFKLRVLINKRCCATQNGRDDVETGNVDFKGDL